MKEKTEKSPFSWIPIAVIVWAVIFGGYEVAERLFLKDVGYSTLYILHIARGTITSFILASVVAWYVIKHSKERIAVSGELAYVRDFEIQEEGELIKRNRWLIKLRWFAIAGVVGTIALTSGLLELLPAYSAIALIIIAFLMVAYNVIFAIAVSYVKTPKAVAFSQVLLDLIALTLLLHFSGGIENPFFAFFVFHVIIASILLRKDESYIIAVLACLLFSSMVLAEYFGLLQHYPLGFVQLRPIINEMPISYIAGILTAFCATTFFSTYFATTIMASLRKREVELRRTTELLAQEKTKLSDIVQGMGAGLMVLGKDLRIVWLNDKIKEWFRQANIGMYCRELWGGEDFADNLANVFIEGRLLSYEYVIGVGSSRRYYIVTASPIRNLRSEITHILELVQDITRMKEMEIQLVQAGKMVAVGQLASGIAHEINNPLATISASSEFLISIAEKEVLKRLAEFEPFRKHLKRIDESVFRCKNIIQNLLSFARKEDTTAVYIDINSTIEETLNLVQEGAKTQDKEIMFEKGKHLPSVNANPRQIQQVILNMVMNALDAISGKGAINIRTYQQDGMVAIDIVDTGVGIPSENLNRIFDPFFTTKAIGKGTGLGLYLCNQIISNIRGKIDVQSEVGKGSVFTVKIPVK